MSAMQDMTKGGAAGHLLRYAVPLMLGNWFQLAYNAVDSIIAGRFIGKDALAADGCLFTNAYATTASCSASRSVVMTGLHNHANGQYGHQHDTGHFSCYANTVSLAL